MYHNFATKNAFIYGNHNVLPVNPKKIKILEIRSPSGEIVGLEKDFGNVEFWDGIDELLEGKFKTFSDEL